MEGKIQLLRKLFFFISILALIVGVSSCNLPENSEPANDSRPQENHPQEPSSEEPMPGEEQPPAEPPHEEPAREQPPQEEPPHEEPAPGGQEGGTGSIFGRDPAAAGSIMPLYEGACPASKMAASCEVDPEGNYRFDDLQPGTYCLGWSKTVQVEAGREIEVNLP
ncbi:MAG: hypothetical protein JXA13_11965 [Anaerolineales bacterium]|nr:hypothetical protein [Anaerolineales bacterium]